MSTSDLLSNEEVKALLNKEQTASSIVADGADISVYDFAGRERIVRGRLPTLDLVNERFARQLQATMSDLLGKPVEVSAAGVEMKKFGDHVNGLPTPCNLNLIKMPPLRGTAIIGVTPQLVFSFVDCFFGGTGEFARAYENREFTTTEMQVVRMLVDGIISDLGDAWSLVIPMAIEFLKSEVNPRLAQVCGTGDAVVDCGFQVEFEGRSGAFDVAIPYSMVEPIREQLEVGIQGGDREGDERWLQAFRKEIVGTRIPLTIAVGTGRLTLDQLFKLKAGDVLAIEMSDLVLARAEGVPIFRGTFGVHNSKYSVKLSEWLRTAIPAQIAGPSVAPSMPMPSPAGNKNDLHKQEVKEVT
ncbi:MAG: flagellar motor switch protein FliM [Gammaproteobacteria bacterium]|nr:flagellar motor switch protein FliM [Gammaproteobacteria bacterium]